MTSYFSRRPDLNGYLLVSSAIAAVIALPVVGILLGLFTDARDVWSHLASTVLMDYIGNSLVLMVGVGVGTALIGTATAWLVTRTQFPGRSLFTWALLLPLAAPAYILAYVYTDFLDYYGPIQTALRSWFQWETMQDYWFPPVRSLGGAIVLLTLTLYPYVYLLARSAFLSQSVSLVEASRSLGCSQWQSFWTVALPLARPAIMAGLALALMETLNDFGTVEYFSVPTFTTGIYRTWFGMGERAAAMQLAALLLAFIGGLVAWERWSRRHERYYQNTQVAQPMHGLTRGSAIAAFFTCLFPIVLGFLLPGGLLLQQAIATYSGTPATSESDSDFPTTASQNDSFWTYASHSFTLAFLSAAIAVMISLILAYGTRLKSSQWMSATTQIATLGYAVPGAVIAVGVLVPLGKFDNAIAGWIQQIFGIKTGLILSGTIAALVFAYLVRFLAVSFGAVSSSLSTIKPTIDDAARSLGYRSPQIVRKIHLPLMQSGLLTGAILVFVDVMKELPATLIIRPFNFDTLAIRVYNLASDERLAEAAGSALAIVGVGLIPVLILSWQMSRTGD